MNFASSARRQGMVEWGVAAQAKKGEATSGDRFVAASFPGGILVGAVDGLGHGDEAAAAAARAARILEAQPQAPLVSLVRDCHDELIETRGVVLSLASLDASQSTLTWLGVGNVEAVLLRADAAALHARESLLLRGGVVGYQLPPLQAASVPVAAGDLLIFATDGVHADFAAGAWAGEPPQPLAERILRLHGRETDDALVLVVEILGAAP
jgi:negative regulator of sigma-B (phosphoserine phosphatase)